MRQVEPPSHRSVQDALWLWPADGPAEDRHAAAAGWPHHRLGRAGDAAGRRSARAVLVSDQAITTPQIACGITRTTLATHAIIRANLHRAPMYSRPDRSHRAALLPLDRGQGRPLRRPRKSTRFSWSQKDLTTTPSIPTAFPPPCPRMSSWRCSPPFRAWKKRWCAGPAMPSNMTMSIRANCRPALEVKNGARPLSGRPDQRHHRL